MNPETRGKPRPMGASGGLPCYVALLLLSALGCGTPGESLFRGAPPDDIPARPRELPPPVLSGLEPILEGPQVPRSLPISLETVFRLAADKNGQVALGRAKLNEALANQDITAYRWLPDVTGGTSYYRHEGGISDFYGNLINSSYGSLFAGVELKGKLDIREATYRKIEAERQVWQQKGELSKLTAENLLDAATTYIDFLAARTGLTIALDMEKKLDNLLADAQKLAAIEKGYEIEVNRVRSELFSQKQVTRKLQESANSAAAKLAYLLGLEPGSDLVPLERTMPELNRSFLVDPNRPVNSLVAQAFDTGPGVREMTTLLQIIDEARSRQTGLQIYVPTVEMTVAEGLFGTGADSFLSFTNRFDMLIGLKWNLSEAVTVRARRRLADAKMQQAHLGYQELRAKLALGVQEARESSLSNLDMMHMGQQQITSAEEAYRTSEYRLRNSLKGAVPSEVLLSLRAYVGARLNYLNAVRELDKAQLRLFVLIGASPAKE